MTYNTRTVLVISAISCLIGVLYYALSHEWIIFRSPLGLSSHNFAHHPVEKKQVTLFYWHHEQWKHEKQEILISQHHGKNMYQLINAWLLLLDEEGIMYKKVTLQSALLSPTGHNAYLSFDRNPLAKEESAFDKWMWIEGLLKTVRENKIPLQHIQFLVHHQALHDQHLDFSKPWPIQGFMNEN